MMINYTHAFKALDSYIHEFNALCESRGDKVKQPVVATAKELIRIYGASLIKASGLKQEAKTNLPSLRTNNVQLAKLCQISPRTVQRHLERLIQAGVIIHKVWHGSNASYEVWINPKILFKTHDKISNSASGAMLNSERKSCLSDKKGTFSLSKSTSCPHTETRNTKNNILIGVDKSTRSDSTPRHISELAGYTLSGYTGEKGMESALQEARTSFAGNGQEKEKESEQKKTGYIPSGYIGNDVDKSEDAGGKRRNSRSASKDQTDRAASLIFYAKMLWKLAKNTLYKDVILTEWQEKNAVEILRRWYEPVGDKSLGKVHQIYVERVALARKYIQRDPKKRFIQLPHLYFDPNNPSGFTGTKAWWNKQQVRNEEVRLKLILAAQVRKFMNNESKESSDRRPSLVVFRECEQRLGKLKKPEILEEFYASIVQPEAFSLLYR